MLSGEIYLDEKDHAAAEDAFSEALLLGSDRSYVVLKLAQPYLQQGKYLNVLRELKLEHFTGPARVELLAYHGEAYLRLGLLLEAERLDPKALRYITLAKMSFLLVCPCHLKLSFGWQRLRD